MNNEMNDKHQEIFDVLECLNGQHKGLEGFSVEEYVEKALKVSRGFFTTMDLRIVRECFPRMNYHDGLIVGDL